jgi:hypothetical protein
MKVMRLINVNLRRQILILKNLIKMKNLNVLFLILLMGLLTFTSCENEEAILDDQVQDVTVESESITAALNAMTTNFDSSGNVDANNNPAGNIIFDFCFDFVYPITLSYNTGTTVSVNDLDGLINVIINSTDQLFINGIAFPFDVETFDETTDAIVIQTINNEAEFANLLLTCDFDDIDDCNCFEVYDPVCVEIIDPNGTIFFITYPNECYAQCDGFDDDDYLDDCEDDDYYDDDFLCFEFVYPLDIILDDGTVVTISDDDDFENTMYNNYFFNFVYPFSVELEEDDSILAINNEQEFDDLLEDCFGGDFPGNDCDQCENEPFDPICVEYTTASGETITEVYPNLCFAQCFGYDASDIVDCDDFGGGDPSSCDVASVEGIILGCDSWNIDTAFGAEFIFMFNPNGTLDIFDENFNLITNGTWVTMTDSQGITYIEITEGNNDFNDIWYFFDCDTSDPEIVSNNHEIIDIESDCD